ncbi:SHOCT domain-containing protein [Enterococcus cecorum]|uniref:SHOCT domain-containing protein n=1 Tax=Enterococcus cecorum TaxID=44008 RepID=UPI000AAB33BE|nr:SHOCT domain-containing protein [Enterococcus cecorum]CAI3393046.1 hypothetical protein CIRMBP1307_00856 [Enterococcus cecorum]CAI3432576.1 hypothetical protein CIRMBP1308_01170 [Enterococcus cecorum]
MKSFFLFSKNVIPSRARNLIAIGWWIWTVFIILIILSPDHVNSLPFNYLTLLSQIILFFGIKNVPTSSTWNEAVMLTGILTFNPILILGFYFANLEYKIYTPKETIRTPSTARKVINVGWWLRWVVIGFVFIVWQSNAAFTISFIIFAISQIIAFIGKNKIPQSSGWSVYFMVIGLLTIDPLYFIGGLLARSEINGRTIRTPSTARKVINVGWWLRWVGIGFVFIVWQSNAAFIISFIFAIFQIIAFIGKNKIPQSSGWSVYFMVIGLLTIDPLYFIGGLLARSEINRIETNEMIQQLKSNTISNVVQPRNDMTSEISKLKKLVDQGVLTEEEFSKAKERLIDKI